MAKKYKSKKKAPVKEAPVVEAPVVEAPVVEAPVVEAPVVEAPVKEEPVVQETFNLRVENSYKFLKKIKKGRAVLTMDVRQAWTGSKVEAKKIIKKFTNLETY